MIQIMFEKNNEKILVVVKNGEVFFGNTIFGNYLATIDGLQLSYEGVLKEHPDLKDNPNWRGEAIKRFREELDSNKTEMEKAKYIMEDLKKHGFKALYIQKQGHRPERLR